MVERAEFVKELADSGNLHVAVVISNGRARLEVARGDSVQEREIRFQVRGALLL